MSRLIEEDAAVERISNAIWHLPNDMYPRFNNFDTIHAVVKDAVKGVPSIEPRAKGKWDFIGDNMFMCTSCGAIYTTQQLKCLKQHVTDSDLPPYCPNCGADMRGEEE